MWLQLYVCLRRMRPRDWGLLLLAYGLFLLAGAACFYFLERGQEDDHVRRLLQLRSDIHGKICWANVWRR